MKEPIEKGFSILKKQAKSEPGIVYTLPDGSTTVWLNEYVDAMVQAKVDEIVGLIEQQAIMLVPMNPNDVPRVWERIWKPNIIALIKAKNK